MADSTGSPGEPVTAGDAPAAGPVTEPAPRQAPASATWLSSLVEPQMFVGLAALLVSVCAVIVSIYGAALDRQAARASVWPHVELSLSVGDTGAIFDLVNTGVGPAQIDGIEFTVAGRPADGWKALFGVLLDKAPSAYSISGASERVLPAGGQIRMLHLPREALPPDFMTRLARIGARICYRSAFDEHWQLDVPRLTGRSTTTDVTHCPAATGDALPF